MRILFVKTSSLGDVIHHCPAVSDAARLVRGATIDWVVEEAFADVPRLHRAVHRVIPVALRRWRRTPLRRSVRDEFAEFRRVLAEERYDRIVDTQGLLKSALIARLARGPRHGYDRGSAREGVAARLYAARHPVARALHAVDRNRRLTAAALDYPAPHTACDYGLRAAAEAPLALAEPFCALLTVSSRADKLWAPECWVVLGEALARRGLRCVLPWGSEAERARAAAMASRIEGAQVLPALGIAGQAAQLARAAVVVGVDTGLTHLAAALGRPTVGIYTSTEPGLTGLHGARVRSVGGRQAPPAVEAVLAALDALDH